MGADISPVDPSLHSMFQDGSLYTSKYFNLRVNIGDDFKIFDLSRGSRFSNHRVWTPILSPASQNHGVSRRNLSNIPTRKRDDSDRMCCHIPLSSYHHHHRRPLIAHPHAARTDDSVMGRAQYRGPDPMIRDPPNILKLSPTLIRRLSTRRCNEPFSKH